MKEMVSLHKQLQDDVSKLLAYKNPELSRHIERVSALTEVLIIYLLTQPMFTDTLIRLGYHSMIAAADLHDIGKIAVSDDILLKPGKLTDQEYEIIKTHSVIGGNLLDNMLYGINENYHRHYHDMCRHHHERWDGTGYPDRLAGTDIPLAARILAVADVYEALTSPRVYKPAIPHKEAVEWIKSGAGTQFDPAIVEAFIEIEGVFGKIMPKRFLNKVVRKTRDEGQNMCWG